MRVLHGIGHALAISGSMAWQILWALILGFFLSGVVQAIVRRDEVTRLMPDDRPRSVAVATGLGAAASSCSYAAVALARSLFRKGADFTAAIAFQIASTNLVVELGIILALLLGWQFTVAEFVGGPLMILLLAVAFRLWLHRRVVDAARDQADRGLAGSMEGHAAMDMSVRSDAPLWRRLRSPDGLTATSRYFVMDWAAVWRDIAGGLLVAGAFAAWVPGSWLRHLFLTDHAVLAKVWGPLIGPAVAVVSFVCSVGNVPFAAVLWNGGISFGGVVAFLFADLIIVPILLIYRKYYGTAMALRIFGFFYATMVLAGYVIELVFTPLGLVPAERTAEVTDAGVSWNYTTWLDIAFLVLAVVLVIRFISTGSLPMLREMGGAPADADRGGPPS
ncbi:MAG: permease [Actinomycetota bacterium]